MNVKSRAQPKILREEVIQTFVTGDYYFEDVEDLNLLKENNYRKIIPSEQEGLQQSILRFGVQQAILVSLDKNESRDSSALTIVFGHRRFQAVRELRRRSLPGDAHVNLPVRLQVVDTDTALRNQAIVSVVENIERKNLTIVELANSYLE